MRKQTRSGRLLLGILLGLLATGLFAQTEEKKKSDEHKPVVKTDITVTAKPSPVKTEVTEDIRSLPVNASVLYDPATEVSNAREPGEIIRALPGMDFVFYGQGGIPSGPSVRGYTDRNFGQDIAGFIDGIPLNLFGFVASHGAMDLTMLLPQSIERVELIRGPFNARYGDFHRGGSLNFVTKTHIARPSVDMAVGSFGTLRTTLTYGRDPGDGSRLPFFTTFEGYRTNSYSHHSDLYRLNSYSKLVIPRGQNDISLSGAFFGSKWDAPSYLDVTQIRSGAISDRGVINPTDGGDLHSQLFYAAYHGNNGSPNDWSATLYGNHRNWNRWRHDLLISPSTLQLHQFDSRITIGTRVEKNFGASLLGRPSLLLAGFAAQRDDASTQQQRTILRKVATNVDNIDELLTNSAVYVQEQYAPMTWLKLSGGLRYNHLNYNLNDKLVAKDKYVSNYTANRLNSNFGVALHPFGSETVLVYASAGSGMRSPTPRSEVRNSINSVNRVSIAKTRNYEAGLSFHLLGGLEIQGDVFRSDNTNEIRAIPPGIEFESLGKSRRKGAEVDAAWFFWSRTARVYTNLSWVTARLTTPATPTATHFPDIARYVHRVGFERTLALGGGTSGGLLLGGDWAWYGRKDLNTTGTIRSDPYQRATARATYVPPNGLYRMWVGGFYYPASRFGESAFLFGSRVGVRANPRTSFEVGISRAF
ncbi:MAG: TonB-dependent receptor plug domain-containing protein [Acidobacteriota bacterium]|nr:TonB-dependent receptor plug domain-containing protein [Acidobacteriota bacterium]